MTTVLFTEEPRILGALSRFGLLHLAKLKNILELMRETLRKFLTFAILVLSVGAAAEFILICKNNLSAPENLISEEKFNIEVGDKTEKFVIQTFSEEEGFSSYLIRKGLRSDQKLKLIGFEKDISFYKESAYDVGGAKLLLLYGDVGVHAQNIQVLNVEEDKIKTVSIADGQDVRKNVVSDVPSFKIDNEAKQLLVDSRDYDKDPTMFSKRSVYTFKESSFVFDRSEDISYNEGE